MATDVVGAPPVAERFARAVEQYHSRVNGDRETAADARRSASRFFVIGVAAVVAAAIFGMIAIVSIAMLRTNATDRFFAVPENAQGVAVGPAFQMQTLGSPVVAEVERDLADTAGWAFTVSTDGSVNKQNLARTYLFLDGAALSKYNLYLAKNSGANSPAILGRSRSVTVRVTRDIPLPGQAASYDLAWVESIYEQPSGRLLTTLNCEMFVSVGRFKSAPTSKSDADGSLFAQLNPYRIAVDDFSPARGPGIDESDCGLE